MGKMERRQFLGAALGLAIWPLEWTLGVDAETEHASVAFERTRGPHGRECFPITAQLSPVPNGAAWANAAEPEAIRALRAAIDQIVAHGFTGLEYPFHLGSELDQHALEYARSRGMFITYNHTFDKGGVENFGRNAPPPVSVYAQEYVDAVRKNLAPVLAEARRLPSLYNIFCYQDEPFHAGSQSFDFSVDAQREFRTRFGYELPLEVEAARTSPKQWLDLINFQSDTFAAGWKQVYKLIKSSLPK